MFKNILNTVSIKIFSAIINLLLIVVNSNILGSEGLGIISLIILAISIFILVNSILSGSLVYFVPRASIFKLIIVSYFWLIISIVFFSIFIFFIEIAPSEYITDIIIISIIQASEFIHNQILVGKEEIIKVNQIFLIRTIAFFLSILFFYYILEEKSVDAYLTSLIISSIIPFVLTLIFSLKYIKIENLNNLKSLFLSLLKLSGYNALGNIFQKMNYRLSFYFIEYFLGLKALGIFSLATQITESILIISRSIAFVQYSKIANLKKKIEAIKITVFFIKFTFLISVGLITAICLLPSRFYTFIFSNSFENLNIVIYTLAIGIIALSTTAVISPYFSGRGNQHKNALTSFIGLIFTIILGYLLIPNLGIIGAGIATSFSYLISFLFHIYLFSKDSGKGISVFLFKKKDFEYMYKKSLSLISKQKV